MFNVNAVKEIHCDQQHMYVIFQVHSTFFIENYFSSENTFNTANKQQSTCCCQICFNKLETMPINTIHMPYDNIPVTSEEAASVSCPNGCKFHSQCILIWLQVNNQQQDIAIEGKNKCPFCDIPLFGLRNIYSQIVSKVSAKEMHPKELISTVDTITLEVEQNNNKHQVSTNEKTIAEEEELDYYSG